jgi:hypothetical protein
MIPLDPLTETAHDCPVWKRERAFNPNNSNSNNQSRPQQSGPKYYPCRRGCGSQIYFDEQQKTESGKWIPIDKETGQPHDCGR